MDFRDAMDAIGLSGAEAADALGLTPQTVRQMRLDPGSVGYRTPPDDWRSVFAAIAKQRGGELAKLARELQLPE